MKTLFLTISFCAISFVLMCQEIPDPIGFRMKVTTDDIKIYRDTNGMPDLRRYKVVDNSVWFKVISTDNRVKDNVTYVLIRIPDGDGKTSPNLVDWTERTDGNRISAIEFNIPLWIRKSDFDDYSELKYPKITRQFTWGALTVPFRVRPASDTYASSIFNGDFNVGTYIGYRFALENTSGISVVGAFGYSSLNQNASNNTSISGASSQSMSAVNYGGGVFYDWGQGFQLGLFLGRDNGFDELSKHYIYQNKNWWALSLNFNFLKYKTTDSSQ